MSAWQSRPIFNEDFSWAGTFGSFKDGLHNIGQSPEYENALFVLGFGGNAITFSIQGMDIIPIYWRENHINSPNIIALADRNKLLFHV